MIYSVYSKFVYSLHIYKKVRFWALIFIIIIAAVSAFGGDDSPNTTTEPVKDNNVKAEIEYTAYSVDEMMDDLNNNALTARYFRNTMIGQ